MGRRPPECRRRRSFAWPYVALFCAALTPEPAPAQGGPPLLTDDPFTPGPGRWEINVALTAELRPAERGYESPLLDLNYGLGERIQLKYELPWVVLDEHGDTRSGLGNSNVGVKWRFYEDAPRGLAVSVYPQLEFNNPTDSADRGLVDRGTALLLPVELSLRLGPVDINPELGYAIREKDADELVYGLALSYAPGEALEWLGELHGTTALGPDETDLVADVGLRWAFGSRFSLLAAAGTGLIGPGEGPIDFLGYLGLQLRL